MENWDRVALVYRLRECHLKSVILLLRIFFFQKGIITHKGASSIRMGGGGIPPPPGGGGVPVWNILSVRCPVHTVH